jgi:hypothetical protein
MNRVLRLAVGECSFSPLSGSVFTEPSDLRIPLMNRNHICEVLRLLSCMSVNLCGVFRIKIVRQFCYRPSLTAATCKKLHCPLVFRPSHCGKH